MNHILVKINGMNCNHCKMSVEKALSKIDGIESVSVDLQTGEADIFGNPDVDEILSEIDNLGYSTELK